MIRDANELDDGRTLTTNVCIVGAGAAGITVARELIGTSLDVVLLEGGGLESTPESQDLYEGQLTGRPFGNDRAALDLANTRLRYFGGTTNHWAGFCRPLEPAEFAARDWLPVSGWPIDAADLAPFYDRAVSVLELADTNFSPDHWAQTRDTGAAPVSGRIGPVTYQIQGQRFGPRYRPELEAATNVRVWVNANATNIEIEPETDAITAIEAATLDGTGFRVEADAFVLAMGGIENPRLLLASNRVRAAGIANQNDLVGRYFTEHVQASVGFLVLNGPPDADSHRALQRRTFTDGPQPVTHAAALSLNAATVEAERLVGVEAQFLLADLPGGAPAQPDGANASAVAALLGKLQRTGVATIGTISATAEQQLDPESRITLLDETDALGTPRVSLHWKQADIERASMIRFAEILGEELGRVGGGRVQVAAGDLGDNPNPVDGERLTAYLVDPDQSNDDLFHLGPGNHHMCTTRMAADPQHGVVDANCRVHDTANLYIAGSSVFATGGVAPPTFTLTALAIRLADHLKATLA